MARARCCSGSTKCASCGPERRRRVQTDRYGQYYEDVLLVKARPVGTMQQFVERVAEMEMISLRELQDFCREQRYFGYIF